MIRKIKPKKLGEIKKKSYYLNLKNLFILNVEVLPGY